MEGAQLWPEERRKALYTRVQEDMDRFRRRRHRLSYEVMLDVGMCIPLSALTAGRLLEVGEKPFLQAGTAAWPIIPDVNSPPAMGDTHFSYQYEPDLKSLSRTMSFVMGCIPEMHAWIGLKWPEGDQVLDFGVGDLPRYAGRLGIEWKSEEPPPFYWQHDLPDGVVYKPVFEATMVAVRRLVESDLRVGLEAVNPMVGRYIDALEGAVEENYGAEFFAQQEK